MDNWHIEKLSQEANPGKLESRIRRMLKENDAENKRIDYRRALIKKGVAPENIERIMSRRYRETEKVEIKKTANPEKEKRKALKKNMRSRRR